jgi:hypothetical protein
VRPTILRTNNLTELINCAWCNMMQGSKGSMATMATSAICKNGGESGIRVYPRCVIC